MASFPSPPNVPPSVFLTLPTVYSSTYLCGLVSSHNHVQDLHSRGFPRSPADPPLDVPCPHVIDENLLPPSCLNGARSSRLAYRALIQAAIRCD